MKTAIYLDGEFYGEFNTRHVESVINELEFEFNIVDETWIDDTRIELTTESETDSEIV